MNATGEALSLFDSPQALAASGEDDAREIDAMTFEDMLRLVRQAPLTHPLFRGATGRHFHESMRLRRHALTPEERDAIKRKVGF